MSTLYIAAAFGLGLLLCAALYGVFFLLDKYLPKKVTGTLGGFLFPLLSILPTIPIMINSGRPFLNFAGAADSTSWIFGLVTVGAVLLTLAGREGKKKLSVSQTIFSGLEGAAMEIPQRLMMQSFLLLLLTKWNVPSPDTWSCFVNALVWCCGIAIQSAITRKQDRDQSFDMVASFLFSFGIGIVYLRSELILLPMVCHFAERILSQILQNRRVKRV